MSAMDSTSSVRHALVRDVVLAGRGTAGHVALRLWQQLHGVVAVRVGEEVFIALFARTALMMRAGLPWLPLVSAPAQRALWFSELKAALDARDRDGATEATCLTLIQFTDILALLIGETMTTGLLTRAWLDPRRSALRSIT